MKTKTILLIDDNQVDNYITRHLLIKNNITENINVQSSGIEALKFLEGISNEPDQIPDYIFLDIKMPEMDGFEFLDEYLLLPDTIKNKCVIFILSSSGDQIDIDKALNYSYVKKFLQKPLNINLLKESV